MRFPSLLVAIALSVAVVGPAEAAPSAGHGTHAKGKPKAAPPKAPTSPKKPGKKKHAHAQAPKVTAPAEDPPLVRPLVAIPEPVRIADHAPDALTLVAADRPDATDVTLVLRVPSGAGDDPADQAGAALVTARAVEHALTGEIRGLREVGGDVAFEVDADASVVRVRVPRGSIDAALEVLSAAFSVEIAPADVDAAHASIGAVSTEEAASDRLFALAYQGWFPYEHPTEGDARSRGALDDKAVNALHRQRWAAEHATLAVVGSDAHALVDAIKARFDGSPSAGKLAPRAGTLQEQTNQRTEDVERAGAHASIRYAWALPTATPAEMNALDVAARLVAEDVEAAVGKLSMAAIVRARVERRVGPSVFVIEVDLPDDAPMKKARHAVEDAFVALSTKAATGIELAHAKEASFLDVAAMADDPSALAAWLAAGGARFEDVRVALDAVTSENVRAAAAKLLGPLTRSVVVVRDPARAPKEKAS